MRGRFITLEGMDGAGKSSHLSWIPDFFASRGIKLCVTREPGGTPLGEALRQMLLNATQKSHPDTEALLMFAARREHIAQVIEPALSSGQWVLCDRFTDATFAYQAGGSGLDWGRIEQLEAWVQGELQPHLTLYFDVPSQVGKQRTQSVRAPDRFESEGMAFFDRVRAGYLKRLKQFPHRMHLIDSTQSYEDVKVTVESIILSNCF